MIQELINELGIYLVFYDRAGYGESNPDPSRSVKSEAYDIEELANKLQIGPKFYVMGLSMGGYPVWGCLKYIPHRHEMMSISSRHLIYRVKVQIRFRSFCLGAMLL